ncbi:MAG: hypothetical protein JW803_00535 [Endomicrobiales bacterium]|nr:hypothetical protein [Endomicrobiales bacterium]
MRKTTILLTAVLLILGSRALRADDFAETALGQEIVNLGLKFLDNPGDFFFNLHTDNEDYSPLPQGRRVGLRFNFFPTFMPLTWANLNVKVKALSENGPYPQIDGVVSYGDMLALRAIEGDVEPKFTDYSMGFVASKSINDKTKIFGGAKYSTMNMDVTFSTPVVFGAFEMNSLNFKMSETFFFTGLHHRSQEDRYMVAQIGYGFKYKKIISRIMVQKKHFEYGMDIFPEGLFVIHPFMAWHWYF